jgi:hypothetical protein
MASTTKRATSWYCPRSCAICVACCGVRAMVAIVHASGRARLRSLTRGRSPRCRRKLLAAPTPGRASGLVRRHLTASERVERSLPSQLTASHARALARSPRSSRSPSRVLDDPLHAELRTVATTRQEPDGGRESAGG